MKIETQKIDGYWVIEQNKWHAKKYTQEQAEKYADTLVNCTNCINCRDCRYCGNCRDCSGCSYCGNCSDCSGCRDCSGCIGCIDCRYCRYCRYCGNCRDCRDCSGCSDCRDCIDCRDFKSNPQRITSPNLGSRDSQTTFYWNEEKEQIVCGCFRGTLEEFEEQVKITHGENEYAQGYFKWIDAVKNYKLTYGGNK